MDRPKVALGTPIFPAAQAMLETVADTVGIDAVAEAHALYGDGHLQVDTAFLEGAPLLRTIGLASVGYDGIDVAACTARGVAVSNCRGTLTEATADLTFLLVLCAMRNINAALGWVRSGQWLSGPAPFGADLEGKLLGIVGLGAIGAALAKRARASGMRIAYHNRTRRADEREHVATYMGFEELLAAADCLAVLIPLSGQSRKMFGRDQFAKMKPEAFFVNAARGGIVDTDALYEALAQKRIAGAALDVTDPEPLPPGHPLLALPNVFVLPHIGSATPETRERMSLNAAQNIVAGLRGEPLLTPINEPLARH